MGRALFDNAGFLAAARTLACERGPAAVTIDSVTRRLKAPKGSFYYRFASRDALLGELWLETALAYQEGFVAAIEAGDGLAAALHTPAWVRLNLDDARLLLLYDRHDFVQGDWPAALKRGVESSGRAVRILPQALRATGLRPRRPRRVSSRHVRARRSSVGCSQAASSPERAAAAAGR